jgi:hypothetical protein
VVEHRGESELERADRNWDELLGELRVTQTGVAVLFSLLLTIPFSARFEDVTAFQRQVYVAALLLSAASAIVLIAPVAYHRLLFRQRQKPQVVRAANRMAFAGLGLLGLTLVAVLLLVTDVLLARPLAVAIAAAFAFGIGGLWVLPGVLRRRGG